MNVVNRNVYFGYIGENSTVNEEAMFDELHLHVLYDREDLYSYFNDRGINIQSQFYNEMSVDDRKIVTAPRMSVKLEEPTNLMIRTVEVDDRIISIDVNPLQFNMIGEYITLGKE